MGTRATCGAAAKSGGASSALVPAKSVAKPPTPAAAAPEPAGRRQRVLSVQPWRIALVDDNPVIHAAMRQTFKILAPNWTLDSYLDGYRAFDCITQAPPRVVLMDITMPEMDGIECTRRIKALLPNLPVVMFTARTDENSLILSMMAGASGFLVKPSSPADTVSAVKRAVSGLPALCLHAELTIVQWLHTLGENLSTWRLTARELQIMIHVSSNRCDKNIAGLLKISPSTVHAHLNNIFRKLGVKGREEARRMFIALKMDQGGADQMAD